MVCKVSLELVNTKHNTSPTIWNFSMVRFIWWRRWLWWRGWWTWRWWRWVWRRCMMWRCGEHHYSPTRRRHKSCGSCGRPTGGYWYFPEGSTLYPHNISYPRKYIWEIYCPKRNILSKQRNILPVQLSIFPKEHHLISSNICKRRNVTSAKWGIIDVSRRGYHLKIWCLVTSALILLIEMKNVTTAKWGIIDVSQRSHHLAPVTRERKRSQQCSRGQIWFWARFARFIHCNQISWKVITLLRLSIDPSPWEKSWKTEWQISSPFRGGAPNPWFGPKDWRRKIWKSECFFRQ